MAEYVEVIGGVAATGGGTQDITFAGFGTVAGAIIYASLDSIIDANTVNDAMFSATYFDGTNTRCVVHFAEDAVGTSNTKRYGSQTDLILLDAAGAVDGVAAVSFIANGIRLTWSNAPTTGIILKVVLFSDACSVFVGDAASNATQNATTAITGVGFEPDCLFVGSHHSSTWGSLLDDAKTSHGFCDNYDVPATFPQGSVSLRDEDNVGTTALQTVISSAYVAQHLDGSADEAVEVTAFGADGFTVTTREAAASITFAYFAVQVPATAAHFYQMYATPGATGNDVDANPRFTPIFMADVLSDNIAVDAFQSNVLASTIGVQLLESSGGEHASQCMSVSAAGTSQTTSITRTGVLDQWHRIPGERHVATWVSWDTLGFTLNYTTANASIRFWPMLVLGAAGSGDVTWTDVTKIGTWTAANWSGSVFLDGTLRADMGTARARLFDQTAAAAVASSVITSTSATPEDVRSSALTLVDGHKYVIQTGTSFRDIGFAANGIDVLVI